jgi:hypothetical protein
MKIEIEFKTGTVDASQISKKISPILDSVKEQGLDSREFSIEMDIGSNGSQFAQKISSVFESMNQQGLKAKEVELELSTRTIRDSSQAMQKISAVVNSINDQGFEVKELEVDSEKED